MSPSTAIKSIRLAAEAGHDCFEDRRRVNGYVGTARDHDERWRRGRHQRGDAAGLWRASQAFMKYGRTGRETLRRMIEFHELWLRDVSGVDTSATLLGEGIDRAKKLDSRSVREATFGRITPGTRAAETDSATGDERSTPNRARPALAETAATATCATTGPPRRGSCPGVPPTSARRPSA